MGLGQIPPDMTEQQAREFWNTHEITEEYLERAGSISEDALSAARNTTRTILLRLDADTFRRVKSLARREGVSPQEVVAAALADWLRLSERDEGLPARAVVNSSGQS